jgi:trk system potassium uptake protein TrkH
VNHRFVLFAIGKMLQVLALVLFLPFLVALFSIGLHPFPGVLLNPETLGFLIAIASSFLCGTVFVLVYRRKGKDHGSIREGFAIVTFGWLFFTLIGAIPLLVYFIGNSADISFSVVLRLFTDAFFEIMSGFTTTGATILTDVERMPRGLLFWRSMTHWLGGMGIVTLSLVIFPTFGVAAYQMFRGEVPGPSTERLRPRLAQTASLLWAVYALLTLLETLLLWAGGMTLFDALCHAFGTMATGGFSTKNASIGAYDSDFIDWVVVLFMFLAGMNFIIHYQVLFNRNLSLLKTNREFRFYAAIICIAILIGTLALSLSGISSQERIASRFRNAPLSQIEIQEKIAQESDKVHSLYHTVRQVSFQVISLTTTTGYCTADFDVWPTLLRLMLFILMFFGGCAGSTGGGMKMVRIMVVLKTAWREVRMMIQPRLVLPVKIGKKTLEEKQVSNIAGFFVLFVLLFVFFSLLMSLIIPDFTTAISTVVSTMCNIGPGLSGIGAYETYAWIPLGGKWVLVLCMLLGRLEVFTVIIAFAPASWKR